MSGETKGMFPAGTTASLGGYTSPTGELLIGVKLTQEEVDAWNGVKPKKKKSEAASYSNRSSKDDLEEYGRTIGIELDKRKSKSSLLKQLKEFKNQLKEELFPTK
jgi:hypothetical protein